MEESESEAGDRATGEQCCPGDSSGGPIMCTPPLMQTKRVAPLPKVGDICTMNDNH
jgi:hypothetical protein